MLHRRDFLKRSSLVALSATVPGFLADTARAATPGKDPVLVVIEMTGGNDGLNTVIPYADDLYHKARPTLRFTKDQVIRVDDHIGLHPAMRSFDVLLKQNQLAIVQGVGYPNPDRSHFESIDIWQSADPKRQTNSGWIARGTPSLQDTKGNVPALHIGGNKLPLALQGAPGTVVSINDKQPYRLRLQGDVTRQKAQRKLLDDLARDGAATPDSLLGFVQRRQVQTYATLDRLEELLKDPNQNDGRWYVFNALGQKLNFVARLLEKDFGSRVFYVNLDGFDTHAAQAEGHQNLLRDLADSVTQFFQHLQASGNDQRVVVLTFSEFGRRVQENGSKGTDHGAASCLFVAGPAVKGGTVGAHPSLQDLDEGDLKHHTDFRRVYATLLDKWLRCDSRPILGGKYEHLDIIKAKV